MKLLALNLIAAAFLAGGASAQVSPADSTFAPASPDTLPQTLATIPAPAPSPPSKIFYGGSVMLSFGDVDQIGIYPMIGYKLSPKLAVGGKIGYEYLSYDDIDQSSHNYGAGVFGRYLFIPQLYGQAEFQLVSYDLVTFSGDSEREAVPFLLLGGGFIQKLSPRTSFFTEVLVDVLQDDNSPYDDWEPRISLGIGVGF
jgi:hypothetical protein